MPDSAIPSDIDDELSSVADDPASSPSMAGGGGVLGPRTEPAESGRRADSLLTPDVTGGSEGFANTPGGTLLAPDVAPDEIDPNTSTGSERS